VRVPRTALGDPGNGEYFSFDLEGGTVYAGERVVGVVAEVLASGGGWTLRLDRSGNEVLVPFVREYLNGVDIDEKRIDVELPEGLAELNG
jgi:16S rRNA processing protein RimM